MLTVASGAYPPLPPDTTSTFGPFPSTAATRTWCVLAPMLRGPCSGETGLPWRGFEVPLAGTFMIAIVRMISARSLVLKPPSQVVAADFA